ncbi:hypothetical protein BJX62DRAFT_179513 [Aspergillus germanicus]
MSNGELGQRKAMRRRRYLLRGRRPMPRHVLVCWRVRGQDAAFLHQIHIETLVPISKHLPRPTQHQSLTRQQVLKGTLTLNRLPVWHPSEDRTCDTMYQSMTVKSALFFFTLGPGASLIESSCGAPS